MIQPRSRRRSGIAIVMALVLMAVLAVVLAVVTKQIVSQRRLLFERERQAPGRVDGAGRRGGCRSPIARKSPGISRRKLPHV